MALVPTRHTGIIHVNAAFGIANQNVGGLKELKPKIPFQTTVFGILKILLDFFYYINIVPCKGIEVHSPNGDRLEFVTSGVRQVISVTVHLVGHTLSILYILAALDGPSIQNDPQRLFQITIVLTFEFQAIYFTKICFKNEGGLKCLLRLTYQFYNHPISHPKSHSITSAKIASWGFCAGALLGALKNIQSNFILDKRVGSSIELINSVYRNWFRFLSWKPIPPASMSSGDYVDTADLTCKIIVLALCVLCSLCISLLSYSCDALNQTITLVFYVLSKDFWENVGQNCSNFDRRDLNQLFRCYRELKSLTEDINELAGIQVFLYITSGVPYYVSNFTNIFDNFNSWEQRLEILYYFLVYITSVALAAEAYNKFQNLPDYIYRHFSATVLQVESTYGPSNQIMMTEISTSQIGLKGHAFFTVSYSSLGHVVSVMLTYIIIQLQFQGSSTLVSEHSNTTAMSNIRD